MTGDHPGSETASLLGEVERIVAGDADRDEKLAAVCTLLRDEVPHYDWVGFYLARPGGRELELGPFAGEPTEHVRIPFGRGVCGRAAEEERTVVVQDVRAEPNYLSCSVHVRSEIVVPVFSGGRLAGELDIDSHARAPFTAADTALLERICALVSPVI
jgi:GAF domain-containing protein